MKRSHVILTAAWLTTMLQIGGCAHHWERPVRADGTYCFALGKQHRSTCTLEPVPTAEADLAAKRFLPDADAFTVFVVRHRWADARNQVPVSVDGKQVVSTIPESLVRIRLNPGAHRISFAWQGETKAQVVEGKAAEVGFVQLDGVDWSGGSSYALEVGDDDASRTSAMNSRLIADVDLR